MDLGVAFVNGLLGLLPPWVAPSGLVSGIAGIGSSVATVNSVFPVTTLALVVAVLLGYQAFSLAWRGVLLVYGLIPFKAT